MRGGRTIGCLLVVVLSFSGQVLAQGTPVEALQPVTDEGDAPFTRVHDAVAREYKGKLDALGPFRLRDLDGKTWTERDFRGRVLIAVLWAAWCGPCVDEFPQVQELHEALGSRDAVSMVSLNLDENPDAIRGFFRQFRSEYSFPVLLAWSRYKLKVLPATWIVDRQGYIREVLLGSGPGWIENVRDLARRVERMPPVSEIPHDVRDRQRRRNVKDAEDSR